MIDSDVDIRRDFTREDCYNITPNGEHSVSVSATLLATLAQVVRSRGEMAALDALIALENSTE